MLEKYKEAQPQAYRILENAVKKNEHSHAYILETNGYTEAMDLAKSFAKALFCVGKNENVNNICQMIDNNNFPELEIIDPEGLTIKKEEIEQLQSNFSKKPLYSDKKIYIINNAERLNKSSGNAILKFLEEPNQDIVAILITSNLYEMLDTIISRCQIVSLRENRINLKDLSQEDRILIFINKTQEEIKTIFNEIDYPKCLTNAIDFINYYEKYKLDSFIYVNDKWFNIYKEKEQFEIAFKIMTLYYIDILKKACDTKIEIFTDYESEIDTLVNKLSISNICLKVRIIINLTKKIKENNNLNLIIDKLLIELGRSDNIV